MPAEKDRTVVGLLESADSLPIEFRADLQLSAVEAGKLADLERLDATLERLFRDAALARYSFEQRDTQRRSNTRHRKLATALTLHLDALSIRTRIVDQMLRIAPPKARRMLEDVRLDIPSTPCSSPLIPDVSKYYSALGAVFSRAFSDQEKEESRHLALLAARVQAASSPVQLAPLAALLARVELTAPQLASLTSEYSRLLKRLTATDRELAAIEGGQALDRALAPFNTDQTLSVAVRRLAARNVHLDLPVLSLLESHRAFLIRSARGKSCTDITADRRHLIDAFNALLEDHTPQGGITKLTAEDMAPEGSAGSADIIQLSPAPDFVSLLRRITARREARSRGRNPEEELDAAGWEADVSEFLRRIDELDPSQADCHACAFHEKAALLFVFFDFVPEGGLKQRILDRLARFLAADSMQRESPLEWLFQVKLLLNLSRSPSDDQKKLIAQLERQGKTLNMLPASDGARILAALKSSGNYTLYLYANAEDLLRPPYYSPLLQ